MTYIENMFQMSTWEQDFDLKKDKEIFHVPRNGAKSIFLTHFTTMDYDEEQRIKDEEAAEALAEATAKWEEPADKKRRTSVEDGAEVLIASEERVEGGKAGEQEDTDKMWVKIAKYMKAQPRRHDGSFLHKEEDWPNWVKDFFKRADHGLQSRVGVHIAESAEDEEDNAEGKNKVNDSDKNQEGDVSSEEILQNTPPKGKKTDKQRGKSKPAMGERRANPARGPTTSFTAAARAVGLGSGKKR